MSNSLRPHELQHAGPPCPSLTPGVYPNSCPLSRWCHPTISSSVSPFSSHLQSFRWPKYWSFSFSIRPFNEHSGLISFRMEWLDLLAVQRTLKCPEHALFGPFQERFPDHALQRHNYCIYWMLLSISLDFCCLGWCRPIGFQRILFGGFLALL